MKCKLEIVGNHIGNDVLLHALSGYQECIVTPDGYILTYKKVGGAKKALYLAWIRLKGTIKIHRIHGTIEVIKRDDSFVRIVR